MGFTSIHAWLQGLLPGERIRHDCERTVADVAALEPAVGSLTKAAIHERFLGLRPPGGAAMPPECLPMAFALVREACRRAVGLRPYDVQVLAGVIMAKGHIAEMATGEGKTLTAALPASVLALTGRGVHVATVNAYLAERDHGLMAPVYALLGLTSALLPERAAPEAKRPAYAADITYGTGYEFGFDYLRDQLAHLGTAEPRLGQCWEETLLGGGRDPVPAPMQRPFAHAIVDEIDSVLIDEATTPLIISAPPLPGENPAAEVYRTADRVARALRDGEQVEVEARTRTMALTEKGLCAVYASPPAAGLRPLMRRAWHEYVEQALIANRFFLRDVHYLVRGTCVELIDENTGRSFVDRKWRGGLHQAIEAKESLPITHESSSEVSISRQRLYRLYPFLCGMTGTAMEERREFWAVYRLRVVPVPRHRPLQRVDLPDRVFVSRQAMAEAAVVEIRDCLAAGRPVLVGTHSVKRSDHLADVLRAAGLQAVLLNARQDAGEAEVIARAGQAGRVTIATNMAGRGADIPLGPGVVERGGLHVLGVEFNHFRRVNRQLVGRCARQGDPGSCRFLVSLEDDLMTGWRVAPESAEGPELGVRAVAPFYRAIRRKEQEARETRRRVMREDKWLDRLKEKL